MNSTISQLIRILCVYFAFCGLAAVADNLHILNGQGKKWKQLAFELTSISRHPQVSKRLMGVKADGSAWQSDDSGFTWSNLPLPTKYHYRMIVQGSSDIYALNSEFSIHRYNTNKKLFEKLRLTQPMAYLAVAADSTVWGVNIPGEIYYSKNRGVKWTLASKVHKKHPWKQLAIGKKNVIYANKGNGEIWRSTNLGKSWSKMTGVLIQINTDNQGNLWGVNSSGQVWKSTNPKVQGKWKKYKIPGAYGAGFVLPGDQTKASGSMIISAKKKPIKKKSKDKVTGTGCSVFKPCPGAYSCQPGVHKCYPKARLEGQPCSLGFGCAGGLSCEAGSQVCRAKGKIGSACHATRPCGKGLSCQPGVHKCYPTKRLEGQPCSAGFGCASGLSCEAGSHVCRAKGKVGDSCHATRPCDKGLSCHPGIHKCYNKPRQVTEPCSAGFSCGKGLVCQPFSQRCFPGDFSWDNRNSCLSVRNEDIANEAKRSGITTTYGAGSAQTFFMVSGSEEIGVVYGSEGEFGCYSALCGGFVSDASISVYGAVGEYSGYDKVAGDAEVYAISGGLPVIEIGAVGLSMVVARDFDDSSVPHEVVGSTQSISAGIGLLPAQGTALKCTTTVQDVLGAGGKAVSSEVLDAPNLDCVKNKYKTLKDWEKSFKACR